MATKRENEKRVRILHERLEMGQLQRNDELCEVILEELETLEPESSRWPHRRGDVLRKLRRIPDALQCYERAVALYAHGGFLPRAIAMAKLMAEIDPTRLSVLERIDPSAARDLSRKMRPAGVRVGDLAPARSVTDAAEPLEPVDAPEGEVRFSEAPPQRRTLEIDVTEVELADALPGPPSLPADALRLDDSSPAEAERQACLPLLPLFAEAPPEALLQLARESDLVTLRDGAYAVRRGDPADSLYGIVEGSVRVIVPGLPEDQQPRLAAGDMFGEACLLGNEPRRADVRAEGELTALRIPKQTLNDLVRMHRGLADVLFEMLTRRLLANLLHTSRLFAELGPAERREVAAEFELRRARGGTELVVPGKQSDALYITLTGHIEIRGDGAAARTEGAGMMFGHAAMLAASHSELGVRTLDTLLVLRLPRRAFSRVAMQYPAILMRLAELEPAARVSP